MIRNKKELEKRIETIEYQLGASQPIIIFKKLGDSDEQAIKDFETRSGRKLNRNCKMPMFLEYPPDTEEATWRGRYI